MLEHGYSGPAGTDEYLRWISGGVCESLGCIVEEGILRRLILVRSSFQTVPESILPKLPSAASFLRWFDTLKFNGKLKRRFTQSRRDTDSQILASECVHAPPIGRVLTFL